MPQSTRRYSVPFKFSIKNLLAVTLVTASVVAFLAGEPIPVWLAALFCLISAFAIGYLVFLSAEHLVATIREAHRNQELGCLTQRFRWMYVDGLIVVWILITIAIGNFVRDNSIANARYLVSVCWFVGALFSAWNLWGNPQKLKAGKSNEGLSVRKGKG